MSILVEQRESASKKEDYGEDNSLCIPVLPDPVLPWRPVIRPALSIKLLFQANLSRPLKDGVFSQLAGWPAGGHP